MSRTLKGTIVIDTVQKLQEFLRDRSCWFQTPLNKPALYSVTTIDHPSGSWHADVNVYLPETIPESTDGSTSSA